MKQQGDVGTVVSAALVVCLGMFVGWSRPARTADPGERGNGAAVGAKVMPSEFVVDGAGNVSAHTVSTAEVIAGTLSAYSVTGGTVSGSGNPHGVYGLSEGNDTYTTAGVWGEDVSSDGTGVRGNKLGTTGIGVYGFNGGSTGSGVGGRSTNWYGVVGLTGRADNNYGLYTDDNLYSLNVHLAGAILQVAVNGGEEALEVGDVVVFAGIERAKRESAPPLIQVRTSEEAHDGAVAGVVAGAMDLEVRTLLEAAGPAGLAGAPPLTSVGPARPGEGVLVVVHGPAQVRVDVPTAVDGSAARTAKIRSAIEPGMLLGTSGSRGRAAPAAFTTTSGAKVASSGTVLGKALESAEEAEDGMIWVFVTLQ